MVGVRFLALVLAGASLVSTCKKRSEADTHLLEDEPRIGDPDKGYHYMVNANYVGCGIPLTLLKSANFFTGILPKPLRDYYFSMFDTKVDTESELPGREGENARLPYYINAFPGKTGTMVANMNCLTCHGEKVNGRVVIGLGNVTRDFTTNMATVTRAGNILAMIEGEKNREEWKLWSRSFEAMAPNMRTAVIGANPAINITYSLISHVHQKTLRWSEEPLLTPPDPYVIPVDVPPWWRLKHRNSVFYSGEFRGDHRRYMMLVSTMCIDGELMARDIEKMFFDVDAYITQLQPPRYPYSVDEALAQRGSEVYANFCSSCHGAYDQGRLQYREAIIPVEVVKTDPELWRLQALESKRFEQWINDSWYGQLGTSGAGNGYIVPPLDGIWATAPYLHNGSVPTIEGVLNSRKRPKYWQRPQRLDQYDTKALGWWFEDVTSSSRVLISSKFIYDTTLRGYGNEGHTFGDKLTDEQRTAVLEFLKTL